MPHEVLHVVLDSDPQREVLGEGVLPLHVRLFEFQDVTVGESAPVVGVAAPGVVEDVERRLDLHERRDGLLQLELEIEAQLGIDEDVPAGAGLPVSATA